LSLLGVVTVVGESVPGVFTTVELPFELTVVDESGVDGVVTVVAAPPSVVVTLVDESALARDDKPSNPIAKNALKLKVFIKILLNNFYIIP
jgi:hypothetical protein